MFPKSSKARRGCSAACTPNHLSDCSQACLGLLLASAREPRGAKGTIDFIRDLQSKAGALVALIALIVNGLPLPFQPRTYATNLAVTLI